MTALQWRTVLVNSAYAIIAAIAIHVYVKSHLPLLGTFVGYWLAIPVTLAVAGLIALVGRWWTRLLWLNLPLVMAALYWMMGNHAAISNEPDALAFLLLDWGCWTVVTNGLFITAIILRRLKNSSKG